MALFLHMAFCKILSHFHVEQARYLPPHHFWKYNAIVPLGSLTVAITRLKSTPFCFLVALWVPYCQNNVYTPGPVVFALLIDRMFPLLLLFSIWYILLGVQICQDPLSSAVKFFKDTQFKSITKRALWRTPTGRLLHILAGCLKLSLKTRVISCSQGIPSLLRLHTGHLGLWKYKSPSLLVFASSSESESDRADYFMATNPPPRGFFFFFSFTLFNFFFKKFKLLHYFSYKSLHGFVIPSCEYLIKWKIGIWPKNCKKIQTPPVTPTPRWVNIDTSINDFMISLSRQGWSSHESMPFHASLISNYFRTLHFFLHIILRF